MLLYVLGYGLELILESVFRVSVGKLKGVCNGKKASL